ncbi:MAG: tetratricopeptide repeat protein [Methyloligellaceae bacterium]
MKRMTASLLKFGFVILLTSVFTVGIGGIDGTKGKDGQTFLQGGSNDSLLGNYLSGRFARSQRDVDTAADYYQRALRKDPSNEVILEQAFLMAITNGGWKDARFHAQELIIKNPNHRIAQIFLGLDAFTKNQLKQSKGHFDAVGKGQIVELITALAKAWTLSAEKKVSEARTTLNNKNAPEWAKFYRSYHQALIADLGGQRKIAEGIFDRLYQRDPRSLRIAVAYSRHLARRGIRKKAARILDQHIRQTRPHPESTALLADIRAGKKIERLVSNPRDGMAEIFYGLGEALTIEGGVEYGLIYLRLGLFMEPDFPLIYSAIGQVYEQAEKYELAIDAYKKVSRNSPIWKQVQISKAFALNSDERLDEARTLLIDLSEQHATDIAPLQALGNILRSRMKFEEAEKYFTRAINLIKTPKREHWSYYYARGVCFDRMKKWDNAEADFQQALKLDGDQPLVLNYLGYSWVDKNRNLKQAIALIEKAVKIRPRDGYFVDSLGWAHYRLGNFKEAVDQLEKAVQLRPEDPVINDHLGDAFWKVGRRLEARYQWLLSLSLKPEKEVADQINQKLANGLRAQPKTKEAKVEEQEGQPKN